MNMKYLVIDADGPRQTDTIDDELRHMVNDSDGDVIRFENSNFQQLVVDGEEDDDGEMVWEDDRWTTVGD
jgi:hypothetical protein